MFYYICEYTMYKYTKNQRLKFFLSHTCIPFKQTVQISWQICKDLKESVFGREWLKCTFLLSSTLIALASLRKIAFPHRSSLSEVNWWYFHFLKAQAATCFSFSVHVNSTTINRFIIWLLKQFWIHSIDMYLTLQVIWISGSFNWLH